MSVTLGRGAAALVAGLMIIVVLGLTAARSASNPAAQVDEGVCRAVQPGTPLDTAELPAEAELPTLAEPEQAQARSVGTRRGPFAIRTQLKLSRPLAPEVASLYVVPGPFQRSDGHALEPEQVVAEARVMPTGRREVVHLSVCIDPVIPDPAVEVTTASSPSSVAAPAAGNPPAAPAPSAASPAATPVTPTTPLGTTDQPALEALAGSYTGTILFDDPRVEPASVTYTVNLKYKEHDRVLATVAAGGVIGAAAGLILATGVSRKNIKKSLPRLVASVFAGAAAVATVYSAQYVRDPSWQGDLNLFTTLFVTCVGTAYAAANVAGTATVSAANTPEVAK